MEIKPRQYPHPVLAYFNDDFVESTFHSELDIMPDRYSYQFTIEYSTDNKELLDLIDNEKAYYCCHVECGGTLYRNLFVSFNKEHVFEIPADRLDVKVEVCSFILAAEDLNDYSNKDFHPDFEGNTFQISKGDVLALGSENNFDADKDMDPLKKIPSIFSIRLNTSDENVPVLLDTSGDKIIIKLSRDNYRRYNHLKDNSSMQAVLSSMLIVPSLVSVLELISGVEERYEFEDLRWYRVLKNKLQELGIDLSAQGELTDSSFSVAQQLVGNPLTSSLKDLEDYELEE